MVLGFLAIASGAFAEFSGGGLRQGNPAEHGLGPGDLEIIRALMRGVVDGGEAPGVSLLLAHRGEVIFREAYGWADLEAKRKLSPDDLAWIGSSTKPISATCVMRLVEQGRLDLDAPIIGYLPEFKGIRLAGGMAPSSLPTTRQLLSHTSGIIATTAWGVFWEPRDGIDPNTPPPRQAVFDQRVLGGALNHSLAELARRTARYHLQAEPGSRFAYSGAAFSVAGRIAEVAGEMPFDELLQNHLFGPLGMSRTTFRPSQTELSRMTVKYSKGPNGLRPIPPALPSRGELGLIVPSGGLASTLDDCARFLQAHLEGGRLGDAFVLSEASVRKMRTNHATGMEGLTRGQGYGLGWSIDRISPVETLTISHGGALGTLLWIDLDLELIGVFFTQMQPPTSSVHELTRLIQETVRGLIAEPATPELRRR
jgi:CubicO group peptidase (beta-lactamase class C family)